MARKQNPKSGTFSKGNGTSNSDVEWANFKLTDEEIGLVVDLASDIPALMLEVAKLVSHGCDLSLKCNLDRGNFSAFVIEQARDGTGKRRGISAFARTGIEALSAVCLKHHIGQSSPDRFTFSATGVGIG